MYNIINDVRQIVFKVAIYIRLSKEDLDKDVSSNSLSVENQRNVLTDYVNRNGYILVDVYIDDGYTGTNFDRPAFKRMIKDIEDKKINMVITKDLSRLGRDYIATGEYVEKYFPLHKIRYVALLDGIDTYFDTCNNDIAPFKAVINDMYSRDNSKKIKAALKSMQEKGKWVGGCTPFGYMKDPKDKNHLIINENEAPIVKKIFSLASSGMTYYQIKDKLTSEKVPTPSMIRNNNRKGKMAKKGIWSTRTIKGILSNELYLGDMVQNRRSRISYKIRKVVSNNKEDYIIVKNTHEPLIDKKTFYKINELLENCKVRTKKKTYRLLDGLLYCGECKHRISICNPNEAGRTYMVCNYYRMYSKEHICTSHSFNYDKLEELILKKIKEIFNYYLKDNISYETIRVYYENVKNKNNILNKYNDVISELNKKKEQYDKMYLDKLEGIITNEMYIRISKKIDNEIKSLEEELNLLTKYINKNDNNSDKECNELIKEFIDNPTRCLIVKLIKKIEIYNDKSIDIYFNFKRINFLLSENHHN